MRAATRLPLRPALSRAASRTPPSRRFISSTHPSQKSRSWTSSAVRWGIAVGGIWWYTNTYGFNAYAESTYQQNRHAESQDKYGEAQLPTVDDIAAARRQRRLAESAPLAAVAAAEPSAAPSSAPLTGGPGGAAPPIPEDAQQSSPPPPGMAGGGIGDLEEEAEGQGAFNEETGEINWDCPCLGGMAYGPCGPEFREAFSCFVFSNEDPKGIDCIDRFKGMQDCFRQHPDVYGAELADDGIDDDDYEATQNATRDDSSPTGLASSPSSTTPLASPASATESIEAQLSQDSKAQQSQQKQQPAVDADKELPAQWPDTRSANQSSSSSSSTSQQSDQSSTQDKK